MKPSLRFLPIVLFLFAGCTYLLPSRENIVHSHWNDFHGAKLDYEKIIPGVTTLDDLNRMNFNPYKVPNISIINTTEIINLFMPNPSIRLEDLDPGIQKCIKSRDRCMAVKIEPSVLNKKRVGNFWADLFSFKRQTVGTGWELRGLITVVDGIVTYRDPAGGKPLIRTEEIEIKPLGPAQDIGGSIINGVQKLW